MNTKKIVGRSVFAVVLAFTGLVWAAEWPTNVSEIKAEKGKSVTVSGKLENGAPMDDLTWASNSSMACFPATQNERFRGPHVLYHTQIPARSIMTITVTPKDTSKDLSIYAFVGTAVLAIGLLDRRVSLSVAVGTVALVVAAVALAMLAWQSRVAAASAD